jgi:predicted CXXCH cytochrome family protein
MVHGKAERRLGGECSLCHTAPTDKSKVFPYEGFEKNCLMCHPDLPMSCLTAVEPRIPAILKQQIGKINLPLYREKLSCGSCHRVMAPPDGSKLLRPEYPAFRAKISVKNIHRSDMLCSSCHGYEVRKGEGKPALMEKDIEKLCRTCHDNKRARADIHPSGIVPKACDNVIVPERFPLQNGKLVCTSCHRFCGQNKRAENTSFLRGGPYKEREYVCFECHEIRGYMQFNPHKQLDKSGNIIETVCLYCHSSVPDRNIHGIDNAGFVGNLKSYCIGCHQVQRAQPHPISSGHYGARPSEGMKLRIKAFEDKHNVMFPMSFEGEVLCFTCHNPHQEGVLSGQAAARDFHSRLRMAGQYVVCNACHGGGGLK